MLLKSLQFPGQALPQYIRNTTNILTESSQVTSYTSSLQLSSTPCFPPHLKKALLKLIFLIQMTTLQTHHNFKCTASLSILNRCRWKVGEVGLQQAGNSHAPPLSHTEFSGFGIKIWLICHDT